MEERWPPYWPDIHDQLVLDAIATVPREEFVPPEYHRWSHSDEPLPIGEGQTISQPYVVALMTQALQVQASNRVLEIGTGSGYQTAILAELAAEVYSIERIEWLSRIAGERLAALGYRNIHLRVGDGYGGWPEYAPYDRIIVTAAAKEVPPQLIEQLTKDGRMVIPTGGAYMVQTLYLITKTRKKIHKRSLGGVRFVPLVEGNNKNS